MTQKAIRNYQSGQRIKGSGLAIFKVSSSDLTLNLGGYSVISEMVERPGISSLAPYRIVDKATSEYVWDEGYAFHSIRLTNGRLILPSNTTDAIRIPKTSLAVSLETDFVDRLKQRGSTLQELSNAIFIESLPSIFQRDGMKHWGNSVDNLEIVAGRTAVNMSGMNNAVRDSKIIVTDSFAGTYMFGPGTVIENNIFIFRGMARTESAAPIKLHFGDKAVIRNNIFIIEDGELAPEQAISLIQSDRVTITGNRVFGDVALVRKYDDQTSTVERDNVVMPLSERPFVGEEMRGADQVVLSRLARDEPGSVHEPNAELEGNF